MTWNYRIMRDARGFLTIRSCHYDENKDVPHSWSALPVPVGGVTFEDFVLDLKLQTKATRKPILDEAELEAANKKETPTDG